MGLAAFPEELYVPPKTFLTNRFKNIISYHDMPQGGHFAVSANQELVHIEPKRVHIEPKCVQYAQKTR